MDYGIIMFVLVEINLGFGKTATLPHFLKYKVSK